MGCPGVGGVPGVAEGGTGAGGPEPRARGRGLCRGALPRGCREGLTGAGVVSCRNGPVSSEHRARGVEAGSPVVHRALAASASERCPLGERLCSAEEATAGNGTYTRHGFIFSSLAGCLEKRSEDSGVSTAMASATFPQSWVLSLHSPFPAGSQAPTVPAVSLVLHDPAHRPCPELTVLSAVLQLPVVSVVRDVESQLLPDVGAVVTCKVGHECAPTANFTACALSAPC